MHCTEAVGELALVFDSLGGGEHLFNYALLSLSNQPPSQKMGSGVVNELLQLWNV